MSKRLQFPRKSLPQAGDSLREEAHDLIFDKFFVWAALAIPIGLVGLAETIYRWLGSAIPPWMWLTVAGFCGAMAIWRWFSIKPQLNNLIQGMRGEREVGRMLEELRAIGYSVFHDLPGDGFNVDHALIGPGGVFVIETKTRSKPEGRGAKIDYDGKRVLVNGHEPERDPIVQAEAAANHLRILLKRTTDRDIAVRPVVLFPGWFITPQPRNARVWVLNPKALWSFLQNEPSRLTREDIALFVDRLTRQLSSD